VWREEEARKCVPVSEKERESECVIERKRDGIGS